MFKLVIYLNIFRLYPGHPIPPIISDNIGGRLFDLLIVVLCSMHLLKLPKINFPKTFTYFFLVFCFFIFLQSAILLILGNAIDGYHVSIREIFELYRYFIIFLIFLGAYNDPNIFSVKFWGKIFFNSLIFYSFIVFVNVLDIPILSELVQLFFGSSKGRFISILNIRQAGFFANPNWAAVYLVWLFIFFKNNNLRTKQINFLILLLISILIISTGSRTGIACLFITIAIQFLKKTSLIKILITSLFSIILINIFTFYSDQITMYLPLRIREIIHLFRTGSILEVQSLSIRYEIWENTISNLFVINPYFGLGPLKIQFGSVFDNQYIKWLVWYGSIGLAYILSFYFAITFAIYKKKLLCNKSDVVAFGDTLVLISFVLMISGFTGAFFDNTQLIFLFFILLGAFLRMVKNLDYSVKTQITQ